MWHVHTLVNNRYVSTLYTRLNKTYTLGTLTLLRGNISNNIGRTLATQRDVANETVKIIFLKSILLATWGHLGYHKRRG